MPEPSTIDCAGYAHPVAGLGPGLRVALWLRGCRSHCPGCMSPELWEPGGGVSICKLVDELAPLLEQTTALTVSGGEPFDQPAALHGLLSAVRQLADCEVLVYTGYLIEALRRMSEDHNRALDLVDLLIDGPYQHEQPNTLIWRGSDNQRLHLLTALAQRYRDCVDQTWPEQRPLTLQPLADGALRIIGIPRRGELDQLRCRLLAAGIKLLPMVSPEKGT